MLDIDTVIEKLKRFVITRVADEIGLSRYGIYKVMKTGRCNYSTLEKLNKFLEENSPPPKKK